jgi:Sap, sulfolipid-1-addressing protein
VIAGTLHAAEGPRANTKAPTAVQAADVVAFVIIEFALVIVPFVFLVARPEGVKAAVERFKVWLFKHALQVVGAVALVAGGYMVISGVLRLS